jgi:hypothetical protein
MKLKPAEKFLINKLMENLAPRHVQHFKSIRTDKQRRDVALRVWTEFFRFKGSTHTIYHNVDMAYYWLMKFDEDIKPMPAGYIQNHIRKEDQAS